MNGKRDLLNDDALDLEISKFLETYTVNTVDEDKIDETIDVLRAYMPRVKDKYQVVNLIKNEITYVNKMYWFISILVMILGIIFIAEKNYSIYDTLLYISPVPTVIGIYEIQRGKRENMWELEKSFKYSYSKIMLTRILIIMSFATILNLILSLFIWGGYESSELIRIMTAWIAPISIVFLINVIILNKVSSNYSAIFTSIFWIVILVFGQDDVITFIEGAKVISLVVTIVISISIFLFTILKFYKYEKKYEGDLSWS